MSFLFQLYTDVAWWQLALPWVALILFVALGIWGWIIAIEQKNRADLWEEIENMTRNRLNRRMDAVVSKNNALIDREKSLEAQIDKLISRPRAKNGRFEKSRPS